VGVFYSLPVYLLTTSALYDILVFNLRERSPLKCLSSETILILEYFVMKSAKQKVLAYLSKDSEYNTLTAQKMQSVFGVANPSATINELRNEGHAIYLNSRINANGDKVSFYRLGTPTKRIVAAGIAAVRSQGERAFA